MDRADTGGNDTTGGTAAGNSRRRRVRPPLVIERIYEPDPAAILAVLRFAMDSYNERQAQAAPAQADEADEADEAEGGE